MINSGRQILFLAVFLSFVGTGFSQLIVENVSEPRSIQLAQRGKVGFFGGSGICTNDHWCNAVHYGLIAEGERFQTPSKDCWTEYICIVSLQDAGQKWGRVFDRTRGHVLITEMLPIGESYIAIAYKTDFGDAPERFALIEKATFAITEIGESKSLSVEQLWLKKSPFKLNLKYGLSSRLFACLGLRDTEIRYLPDFRDSLQPCLFMLPRFQLPLVIVDNASIKSPQIAFFDGTYLASRPGAITGSQLETAFNKTSCCYILPSMEQNTDSKSVCLVVKFADSSAIAMRVGDGLLDKHFEVGTWENLEFHTASSSSRFHAVVFTHEKFRQRVIIYDYDTLQSTEFIPDRETLDFRRVCDDGSIVFECESPIIFRRFVPTLHFRQRAETNACMSTFCS